MANSGKSDEDHSPFLNPWIQIIIVVLSGIGVSILSPSISQEQLAIAWLIVLVVIFVVQFVNMKRETLWLRSRIKKTQRVEEMFFAKMEEPGVIQGGHLDVEIDETRGFMTRLELGWTVDILVFSEDRFDFFMLDQENAMKMPPKESKAVAEISTLLMYDRIRFLRIQHYVQNSDMYGLMVRRAGKQDKRITVYIVVIKVKEREAG